VTRPTGVSSHRLRILAIKVCNIVWFMLPMLYLTISIP